tara:strand:+ start:804 stop:1289 length:486 start_codon:yes stop_codon:yes gene_type:complete
MSELVEDKKETSEERNARLLAGPIGQTPQGAKDAMSNALGEGGTGDFSGKNLFGDDNKPTAEMLKSARYIEQVKALPTTTQSGQGASTSGPANNDGKDQGGGVLEFFGLAGGRKRRRKKTRKRKRKSKKKKGGKSRKKRRKSKRKKSRRKRKKSRRRRRRK